MREMLRGLLLGRDLSPSEMQAAMERILAGEASDLEIATLALGLRAKGESAAELEAAARSLRAHACRADLASSEALLDTCGTGGEARGGFNVTALAAILCAACGVHVAKHGNRAVSSRSGSADLLEALGVPLELDAQAQKHCLREVGIVFLFAPHHHAAMRHAAAVRRQIPVPTFFNLLGPLSNPAGASHQLLGVYAADKVWVMAEALRNLGVRGAWVVHGEGGFDEVSPYGRTYMARVHAEGIEESVLRPEDFGVEALDPATLVGGDAAENARLAQALLAGEVGPLRTLVLMNAASALCAAEVESSPKVAFERAEQALDSGAAARLLERWVTFGRERASDGGER